MRTMHISALPLWDLGPGKGRVSTYLPLKAFYDRGHEVFFLTSYMHQESGKFDGVTVKKLIAISLNSTGKYRSALTHCFNSFLCVFQSLIIGLRYKPDVIYSHDVYSSIAACIVSRFLCARYVLRLYGVGKLRNPFRRMMLFLALKLPNDLCIITNDGTSGKAVALKYGVPQSRLCFWVNGINRSWPDGSIHKKLRNALAPSTHKIVLSLCRLSKDKQVHTLIKAIPPIVAEYKKVKFVIVGDGDERGCLENLADRLGVSSFVKFTGAVSHNKALEYMKACDLLISMNALSNVCNPVLEAMICGRPVIASNTGATSGLIRDRYNGILIDIRDTDRLADHVLFLLRNDGLARAIGRNASRFMLSKWPTWSKRAHSEVDLIETLCKSDYRVFARAKTETDAVLDININVRSRSQHPEHGY